MTDTFRKIYTKVGPEATFLIEQLKISAEQLEGLMLNIKSREMSLAMTNLEQAIMWAVKAVYIESEKSA